MNEKNLKNLLKLFKTAIWIHNNIKTSFLGFLKALRLMPNFYSTE